MTVMVETEQSSNTEKTPNDKSFYNKRLRHWLKASCLIYLVFILVPFLFHRPPPIKIMSLWLLGPVFPFLVLGYYGVIHRVTLGKWGPSLGRMAQLLGCIYFGLVGILTWAAVQILFFK